MCYLYSFYETIFTALVIFYEIFASLPSKEDTLPHVMDLTQLHLTLRWEKSAEHIGTMHSR